VPAAQPRALSEIGRKELRQVLNSEEFVDEAPATVYAKLLDERVVVVIGRGRESPSIQRE
jgi:hypothetical protein